MSDTTTYNYQCGCYKRVSFDIEVGDHAHQMNLARDKLRESGWAIGTIDTDKDGDESFFAYCSVKCHNDYVQHLFERHNHDHWWNMHGEKDGPGPKPKCTCMLETLNDGRLTECRHPTCPWHTWLDERRDRRNAEARSLFEQWKNVPIGTTVTERNNVNKGRGEGRTTGPAEIFEFSFGGHVSAIVPWDQPGIHPSLRDLEITE